jgi:hypothetical protein
MFPVRYGLILYIIQKTLRLRSFEKKMSLLLKAGGIHEAEYGTRVKYRMFEGNSRFCVKVDNTARGVPDKERFSSIDHIRGTMMIKKVA